MGSPGESTMTISKLIDKYMTLARQGYETVTIAQVLSDLRALRRIRMRETGNANLEVRKVPGKL